MSAPSPAWIGAEEVQARCTPAQAARAIERALHDGLDPAGDIPRTAVEVEHGQLLLMPSGDHGAFRVPATPYVGVKVASVAPGNPGAGLPRIQATYLLLDGATLTVRAVIDGTALTNLRTPAVSVAAVRRHLLRRTGALAAAVIGAGPQALGHAEALGASLGEQRAIEVTFLVRDRARSAPQVGDHRVHDIGSPEAARELAHADVVVCATSARRPLFDSALLPDHAVVIAVGSHEPGAREVDAALCRRATVVVEDASTALRSAGDVVLAVDEGALDPAGLVPMRDVVTGATVPDLGRPLLFKSVGMSWEDLVVAAAVHDAAGGGSPR